MLLPLLRLHSASSFVSRFMFPISLAARACCVPFVRENMDETSGGNLRYFLQPTLGSLFNITMSRATTRCFRTRVKLGKSEYLERR